MITATVECEPGVLLELVRAGADLNLQNEVRGSVALDTTAIAAPCIIPCCLY